MPLKTKIEIPCLAGQAGISANPSGVSGSKRGAQARLFLVSTLFCVVAASLFILKFAPAPFFWVWLSWAAVLFAATFHVHESWPRAILFNAGIMAIMLAAGEAYLITHEGTAPIYPDGGYIVADDFPRMGIPLDLVEEGLPDYGTNPLKYGLSPVDPHPNALANRLLAPYRSSGSHSLPQNWICNVLVFLLVRVHGRLTKMAHLWCANVERLTRPLFVQSRAERESVSLLAWMSR